MAFNYMNEEEDGRMLLDPRSAQNAQRALAVWEVSQNKLFRNLSWVASKRLHSWLQLSQHMQKHLT